MAAKSPEAIARKRANRKEVERANRQNAADDRRSRWIAIDGEAVKAPDGRHRYCLIATSAGDRLSRADRRLSTSDCLTFLCKLFERHKPARFIGYYLDYDVNQWLCDVDKETLALVWDSQEVQIPLDDGRICALRYMPGSSVEIGILVGAKRHSWARIEDVRGWLASPVPPVLDSDDPVESAHGGLLAGCRTWGIAVDIDATRRVLAWKAQRGEFAPEDLADLAIYAESECKILSRIMARVENCCVDIGLRPARWHGPGSAAAAMMRRHGVPAQMAPVTEDIKNAWLAAYYGGRVQPQQIGLVGDTITYDIRSAYPHALTQLPTMRGVWRHVDHYDASAAYAVWHLRWDVSGEIVAPFPFRIGSGAIHWPAIGCGTYWAPEVTAAKAAYGDRVEIIDGYVFTPADESRPFAFMRDLYRYRRQVGTASPQHATAVKIVMNAAYGKLAQGRTVRNKDPELQSFFWAGMATSLVRAQMLRAALLAPLDVVLFQTDALTTTSAIPIDIGNALGQWREVSRGDSFVLSSGVMETRGAGVSRSKMRGVAHQAAALTDWDVMRFLWKRDGWEMKYIIPLRRFVGMGAAISMRRMDLWRAWLTMNVRVVTAPTRSQPRPIGEFSWRLMPAHQEEVQSQKISKAYRSVSDIPGGTETDSRLDIIMEREQPMPTGI